MGLVGLVGGVRKEQGADRIRRTLQLPVLGSAAVLLAAISGLAYRLGAGLAAAVKNAIFFWKLARMDILTIRGYSLTLERLQGF